MKKPPSTSMDQTLNNYAIARGFVFIPSFVIKTFWGFFFIG